MVVQIISEAAGFLERVVEARAKLEENPNDLRAIQDIAIFGHIVGKKLENLKGKHPSYAEYAIRNMGCVNPLIPRYFRALRAKIDKATQPPSSGRVHYIESMNTSDLYELMRPPPGASIFVGDQQGRSGWELSLPDGSVVRNYMKLPLSMFRSDEVIPVEGVDFPPDSPNDIRTLSGEYVDWLVGAVRDARDTFL